MIDLPRSKKTPEAPRGSLAVVTCHFNWSGYQRPVENLRRFLRQMEWAGVPVYGMELVHSSQKEHFVTAGNKNWTRLVVDDDSVLFQKEACINEVVRRLPDCFDKVAWIDADLEFSNRHVFSLAAGMLSTLKVVQLFDSAVWTDHLGAVISRKRSCIETGMTKEWKGHPGFAWAAQRSLWEAGGLFSLTPVGNGDTLFALTATGSALTTIYPCEHYGTGLDREPFDNWSSRVCSWLEGKTGFVPGECWHAWHGNVKNRQYNSRYEALRTFKAREHLQLDANGLLRWTDKAPLEMKKYVYDYFRNRHEDTP